MNNAGKPKIHNEYIFFRLNLINWLYCKVFKYQGYEQSTSNNIIFNADILCHRMMCTFKSLLLLMVLCPKNIICFIDFEHWNRAPESHTRTPNIPHQTNWIVVWIEHIKTNFTLDK